MRGRGRGPKARLGGRREKKKGKEKDDDRGEDAAARGVHQPRPGPFACRCDASVSSAECHYSARRSHQGSLLDPDGAWGRSVKCGVLSKCFILWVCRFVIVIFLYVRVPVFLAVLSSYVSVCLIYLSVRLSVCLPPIPPSLSLFRSPLSLTSYLSLSLSFFVSDRKYA